MYIINLLLIFLTLFNIIILCAASTHWVVTENGMIQSQLDSIYKMNRPYDLIEFLKQEDRAQNVVKLYEEMVSKKVAIDSQWSTLSSASELETNVFSDDDCLAAKEELFDFEYTVHFVEYSSEDLSFLYNDSEDGLIPVGNNLDCTKFCSLEFTMSAFPHLQVLSEAWNLTWPQENDIILPTTPERIYYGLTRNNTSWYHYNLASLYWRQNGDAQKALDCVKRSMHFAPRHYKDVPLLNLGVMLHKAQCYAEAAILLHSAIDHAPHKPVGHFVLANVYTSLGDYNRSITCYDNAISLKPNWRLAKRARHAIICHNKVKNTLNNLQTSIQEIINQFQELNSVQEQLVKNQKDMLFHQETPLGSSFTTLLSHSGECRSRSSTDDQVVCDFPATNSGSPRDILMDAMSLQLLLTKVEAQAQKISDYVPLPNFEDNNFRNAFKTETNKNLESLLDVNSNKNEEMNNYEGEKLNFKDHGNFTKYQIK